MDEYANSELGSSPPPKCPARAEAPRSVPEKHYNNGVSLLGYNLSDVGNAERFYWEHLNWVLFAAGAWYEYSPPGLWKSEADQDSKNPDAPAVRRAIRTIRRYLRKAKLEAKINPKKGKALLAHARASEKYACIMATVRLAQRMHGFSFDAGRFDQSQWELNTPTGVVDLRTGSLRPARPEDYWTKITQASYNPDDPPWHVLAPRFEQHLEEIMPDPEIRLFLQEAVGLSLTGTVGERLFVALGPGGTGKTTTFNAVQEAIGSYYTATSPALFMLGKVAGTGPQPEVVKLRGARMAVAKETRNDIRWDEATIKQLTDRDPLLARDLYRSLIEFRPTHALWVATNHAPVIVETDSGIWRRIMVVPFVTTPAQRDEDLDAKLKQERDGVLRWIIGGAMRVAERGGLDVPEGVKRATRELQEERDMLTRFVDEHLETTDSAESRIKASDLYKAYRNFCAQLGEPTVAQALFGREMGDKLNRQKSGGLAYYTHVKWRGG